jgi:1,4-alpha-glucan branching enzyme
MEIETSGCDDSPSRAVSILLHAHLPYGIRPDLETSLEQAWLFEAVTGCYLPLIALIQSLESRAEGPWLTLSLSPTLLELWAHPDFARRYQKHLATGLQIIDHEAANPFHPLERRKLALEIRNHWEHAKKLFEQIDGNLCAALTREALSGKVELITTCATHAFLPAFQHDRRLRHFQIENGLETFTRHTGLRPRAFWLPECAYFPGLEKDLKAFGLEYFALESLAFDAADPPRSVRTPLACPNGVIAIARDSQLSQKVWSARRGYPGKLDYREFHHDGIHEVDQEVAAPFKLPDGNCMPFGLKYWRVTGSPDKDWYAPEAGAAQAKDDAGDFAAEIARSDKGLIFLPFDAELFGHWWHEGPLWLGHALQAISELPDTHLLSTEAAIQRFADPPISTPAASTWGRNSDFSFWINHDSDWIYPLLRAASEKYAACIARYGPSPENPLRQRALRQAGRELLLASASDWPFMIRAGTTVDYAVERMREHLSRFFFLLQSINGGAVDSDSLDLLETLNPVFLKLSVNSYSTSPKFFTQTPT